MNPTAINFIDRGGESAWQSPSLFVDPTLYCFAVQADPHCVRDLLARYIDQPSEELKCPVDVESVFFDVDGCAGTDGVPFVFFVFIDSVRRQSLPNPPATRAGQQSDVPQRSIGLEGRERERLFAILVPAIKRNRPHPDELVFFAPYVFASSSPGWRAEREIFGYPQQQGKVRIKRDAGEPAGFSVLARGIAEFGPDKMSQSHTFLSLTRTGPAPPDVAMPAVMGIRELCADVLKVKTIAAQSCGSMPVTRNPRWAASKRDADFMARKGAAARPPEPFRTRKDISLDELLSGPLSMLFLKQFRDIVHSDRACYQAILQAKLTASAKPVVTDLGAFALTLADLDSIPIRRELGIAKEPVVAKAFQLQIPSEPGEGTEDHQPDAPQSTLSIEEARVLSNPHWNPAVESSVADVPSRLPRYVERGGEMVWRQPSRLEGAVIYGFGVRVPLERQEELLERCVNKVVNGTREDKGQGKGKKQDNDNEAQAFNLTPAGLGMVMLLFVDYRRITSGADDDERLGGVAYQEFVALQLAFRRDRDFPELNWYIPFIYLNADSPRVAGREIYGYPKQLGRIDIKPRRVVNGPTQPPQSLKLSATVIHNRAQAIARSAPIIKVHQDDAKEKVLKPYDEASDMFTELLKHVTPDLRLGATSPGADGGPDAAREAAVLLENAQLSNIGNVFLKQFRDCVNPSHTCYQAVCKTDTVPGRFRSGGQLNPDAYSIEVRRHTSEPLFEYLLGDDAADPGKLKVEFAYWLDIDFDLTRGRVIANAFTPRTAAD